MPLLWDPPKCPEKPGLDHAENFGDKKACGYCGMENPNISQEQSVYEASQVSTRQFPASLDSRSISTARESMQAAILKTRKDKGPRPHIGSAVHTTRNQSLSENQSSSNIASRPKPVSNWPLYFLISIHVQLDNQGHYEKISMLKILITVLLIY